MASGESSTEGKAQSKADYGRLYYAKNREKILNACREYRLRNLDAVRERNKRYYEKNKKRISLYNKSPQARKNQKKQREKSREARRIAHKKWRDANREHLRAYKKKRRTENPHLALINRVRCRTWWAINNSSGKKKNTTIQLLGCTPHQLRDWIEGQFKDGMCWERMNEIHLDHIIPLAAFDLTDQEQQKAAFHYTNLRPMWDLENKKKGKRVPGQILFGFAYAARIADGVKSSKKRGRPKDATGQHSDDQR